MKRFVLLLLVIFLTGCSQNTVSIIQNNQVQDYYIFSYNEDLLILEVPKSSLFYDKKLHIFDLDTMQSIHTIRIDEKDQIYGLYEEGYYLISLEDKTVDLYRIDGSIEQRQLGKDEYEEVFLSSDGQTLYYKHNNVWYSFGFDSNRLTIFDDFMSNWEFIKKIGDYVYFKDGDQIIFGYLDFYYFHIMDEVYYVDENQFIYSNDYGLLTFENGTIQLKNNNEQVVYTTKQNILSILDDYVYCYDIATGCVYMFECENAKNAIMNQNGTIYIVDENLYYIHSKKRRLIKLV